MNIRKIIVLFIFILMSLFCFKFMNLKNNNENILHVFTSPDYPGICFKNKNGQLEGKEVEILEKVAKEMKKSIEWHFYDFSSLIPEMEKRKDKYSIVCGGFFITKERESQVTFSEPYGESETVLLSKKKELKDIKNIVIQTGVIKEDWFQDFNIISMDNIISMLEYLKSDRTNAIAIDLFAAQEICKQNLELHIIRFSSSRSYKFGFIINKFLRNEFNNILMKILFKSEIKKKIF